MIDLNSIHIWYISFRNRKLLNSSKLFMILNEEEKDKASAFIKKEDKMNYIISHAYLRLLLTKYYPSIKPCEWEFSINKYGKPFLSEKHGVNLFFNLSHTHSSMVLIFNESYECGIDIEEDRRIIIDDNMINMVLSENEKKIYQNSKNNKIIFYMYWTLKEAYLKALGIGLHHPERIDFSFIKNINSETTRIFRKKKYQFGTLIISKDVFLAYAIRCFGNKKYIKLYTFDDI